MRQNGRITVKIKKMSRTITNLSGMTRTKIMSRRRSSINSRSCASSKGTTRSSLRNGSGVGALEVKVEEEEGKNEEEDNVNKEELR